MKPFVETFKQNHGTYFKIIKNIYQLILFVCMYNIPRFGFRIPGDSRGYIATAKGFPI